MVLVVYYIPRCFPLIAISLTLTNNGRPHISLSFPKVVPPDSDLFTCIRAGQCERIKELLGAGKALVADIAASYGLTPLTLAPICDQREVCSLLIKAGAQQLALRYTWTTSDLWTYIADFSILKSSITAGALLQDYIRLCSAESPMNAIRSCILEPGCDSKSFTRLHKCVLGLTSESVHKIGRLSRNSIDETDSIGRTALHRAAYNGSATSVDGLLRCGTSPNICESNGSTPLHVAAGLGSAACIDILVSSGANLEVKDRFGATPVHYASSQGHTDIMEILLNEGADSQAENYFGETAISYAIYGRRAEAVKTFRRRGDKFDHTNKWGHTPVFDAVFVDSHDILDLFLHENMETTAKIAGDKTLLHIAAANSDLKTIEILKNARLCGLDTTAVDAAGYTAMEYLRARTNAAELVEPFSALLTTMTETSEHLKGPDYLAPGFLHIHDDMEDLTEIFVDTVESQSMWAS